jgi:hypothetical protein
MFETLGEVDKEKDNPNKLIILFVLIPLSLLGYLCRCPRLPVSPPIASIWKVIPLNDVDLNLLRQESESITDKSLL